MGSLVAQPSLPQDSEPISHPAYIQTEWILEKRGKSFPTAIYNKAYFKIVSWNFNCYNVAPIIEYMKTNYVMILAAHESHINTYLKWRPEISIIIALSEAQQRAKATAASVKVKAKYNEQINGVAKATPQVQAKAKHVKLKSNPKQRPMRSPSRSQRPRRNQKGAEHNINTPPPPWTEGPFFKVWGVMFILDASQEKRLVSYKQMSMWSVFEQEQEQAISNACAPQSHGAEEYRDVHSGVTFILCGTSTSSYSHRAWSFKL